MGLIDRFTRKYGGYVIDFVFVILAVWAVIDYYYHGGTSRDTIQAAFALVALYAFVVTRRMAFLRKNFDRVLQDIIKAQERAVINLARKHNEELERLRSQKTPGS